MIDFEDPSTADIKVYNKTIVKKKMCRKTIFLGPYSLSCDSANRGGESKVNLVLGPRRKIVPIRISHEAARGYLQHLHFWVPSSNRIGAVCGPRQPRTRSDLSFQVSRSRGNERASCGNMIASGNCTLAAGPLRAPPGIPLAKSSN